MARKGYECATYMWMGRRHYCYALTKEEARSKADRELALLEADVVTSKSRLTVREWSEKWLEDYKKGATGKAWYDAVKSILDNHILPDLGDMLIREVTASDIKRLMNSKAKYSQSHQRKIAQIILQIFSSAEENNIVVKVPMRKIKTSVRASQSRTRTITDEERTLTLRTAEKYPKEGLPFLIMLYCGCRPQEVARLRMGDYDSDKQILHIRRARKADGSTSAPKSESGTRDVPVPDILAEKLNDLDKRKGEYICTSAQGKPLTKTSQKRAWHKFKRLMDIENGAEMFRNAIVETTLEDDLRPYCYRHTYCTDLQDAGVPLTVAQRFMGHKDIKITADIYTHHTQKSFDDAKEKINKLAVDKSKLTDK